MTIEEFEEVQDDERRAVLSRLLHDCVRRFRQAGDLVGIGGPVFDTIRKAHYEGGQDLFLLFPMWKELCNRYRAERFDAQAGLFKEHDSESLDKWGQFLYWHLFPELTRDDEFVRNVLRVTGLLPCRSKAQSADALTSRMREMALPFHKPAWESWEIE